MTKKSKYKFIVVRPDGYVMAWSIEGPFELPELMIVENIFRMITEKYNFGSILIQNEKTNKMEYIIVKNKLGYFDLSGI